MGGDDAVAMKLKEVRDIEKASTREAQGHVQQAASSSCKNTHGPLRLDCTIISPKCLRTGNAEITMKRDEPIEVSVKM